MRAYVIDRDRALATITPHPDETLRSKTLPRLLLSQNHLRQIAGSELVTQELVEEFVRRGWQVTVYTNLFMPPMEDEFATLLATGQVHVTRDPYEVFQLDDFDLIWIHHSCLPPSVIEQMSQQDFDTPVVWHHMSGVTHIELPVLSDVENAIADVISAVSEEARSQLRSFGLEMDSAVLLPNPAPREFCGYPLQAPPEHLRRLVVVSNHVPDELMEAVRRLRAVGVAVDVVGVQGDVRRVTPELLSGYDAVVTIGKTVQYALVLAVPVYEYDHFGGAGWIRADNMETEAIANFLGTVSERRLTAEDIAEEILKGWFSALEFARDHVTAHRDRYSLESAVSRLLESSAISIPRRKRLSPSQVARWIVFTESYRGLYRTLEYAQDQLAIALQVAPRPRDDHELTLGVVLVVEHGDSANLDRMVACVLQQTRHPEQVSVVANDSDLSARAIARLGSAGIRTILISKPGPDPADTVRAINRAIMRMSVHVVTVLDHAVIWHPRYVEKVVEALHGSTAVAAVAPHHKSRTYVVNGIPRVDHPVVVLDGSEASGTPMQLSVVDALQERIASYRSLVFRRQEALSCGLLNAELRVGHGAEFAVRLLLRGEIVVVPSEYPLLSILSTDDDKDRVDEQVLMGLLRMLGEQGHGLVALSVMLAQSMSSQGGAPVTAELDTVHDQLAKLTASVDALQGSSGLTGQEIARRRRPVKRSNEPERSQRRRQKTKTKGQTE